MFVICLLIGVGCLSFVVCFLDCLLHYLHMFVVVAAAAAGVVVVVVYCCHCY